LAGNVKALTHCQIPLDFETGKDENKFLKSTRHIIKKWVSV